MLPLNIRQSKKRVRREWKKKQFKMYYCNNCNAPNDPSKTSCVQCGHDMSDRLEKRRK